MKANDTPAPPGAVFYLSCPGVLEPAESELPKEVNGQPVGYFWADGIRAGRYVHPAGKFELHVDGPRLDGWVSNFRKMREAGVDVPVPVDHSTRARDNLGYVVDVKRDGDTLKLLHQLIGEDAIRLASRNKVSLGIDPAFTDGRGRAFGDCVVHSSLTPVPLVPGQEGLVPLSVAGGGAIVFQLDASPEPVEVARVREIVGDGERVTPQNAVPMLMAWAVLAKKTMEVHRVGPVAAGEVVDVAACGRRVDDLVRRGNITPACRDGVMALMDARGGRVLLSREGEGPGVLEAVIAALEKNVGVPLGERSGVQTLSRVVPGEEPVVDAALQLKMVRMANGG